MYLIGYDIGSSSIKIALVDAKTKETLDIIRYPEQEMEMISRQTGWAEQQPELWWKYVCYGTQLLMERCEISPTDIKAIGISYQMHGLVLVDKAHQVLRPSIIWCDSRAVSIGDKAFHKIGASYCLEHYQNSPGNFTASKLKWVKDNEPDIYAKIHKVMLPGDFIAMKLTSKISTTISGLSEGILWDFKEQSLAKKLLSYYGIDEELLPKIEQTFTKGYGVTLEASKQIGLAVGTKVCYRAGDQPNNALSLNVLEPGEIAATCGTSGVVYGIVEETVLDQFSRINAFAHVNHSRDNPRIGVLLCINGAGIQYSWLRQQIALQNTSYTDMERMLSSVPVGSEGVLSFPYGNGAERIFMNKNLASQVRNIEFNRHTRAHLFRSALEGVAFTFVYGVQILQELGMEIKKMRVGNDNMFQSEVFCKTIATILNIDIEIVETTGAIGAALGAGYGMGYYECLEDALDGSKTVAVHRPEKNSKLYSQAYAYWKLNLEEILRNRGVGAPKEEDQIDQLVDETIKKQSFIIQEQNKRLAELKKLVLRSQSEGIMPDAKRLLFLLEDESYFDDIDKRIELLSNPLLVKLQRAFPELSYEELELCHFILLKYTSKEIAEKMNLSNRGLETKRYRLRKKMQIPKSVSFHSFFDTFDKDPRDHFYSLPHR